MWKVAATEWSVIMKDTAYIYGYIALFPELEWSTWRANKPCAWRHPFVSMTTNPVSNPIIKFNY